MFLADSFPKTEIINQIKKYVVTLFLLRGTKLELLNRKRLKSPVYLPTPLGASNFSVGHSRDRIALVQ